jgi:hypothetical protein
MGEDPIRRFAFVTLFNDSIPPKMHPREEFWGAIRAKAVV